MKGRERKMIQSNWVGVVCGVVTILIGLYSLFRPESVATYFNNQGVPHPVDPAAQLRRVRILGVAFIFAGGYFLFVTARLS
jgi:hypothetical protein